MTRETPPLCAAAFRFCLGRRGLLPAAVISVGVVLIVGTAAFPTIAQAKSPGSKYCFHGYCHRVGTLSQTDTLVGWRGYVLASYYDSCRRDRLNPCGLTSSGAVFRPDLPDNTASPLLPDGTVILAYNPKTGDASVLRINNAGPYSGKRKLDVSRATAEKLGFRKQGVTGLVISVLQSPTKAEARYVRKRVYAPVPGYIGKFKTADAALEAANERFDARADRALEEIETAALGDNAPALVPTPRLAVSPSLARELMILRAPPKPVNRDVRLVQGPRPVSRADFMAQRGSTDTTVTADAQPQDSTN